MVRKSLSAWRRAATRLGKTLGRGWFPCSAARRLEHARSLPAAPLLCTHRLKGPRISAHLPGYGRALLQADIPCNIFNILFPYIF